MIRLVLLLIGAQAVKRQWGLLALLGAVWIALGVAILADALDGLLIVATQTFGWLLVAEGLLVLFGRADPRRRWSKLAAARAFVLIVLGLLIVDSPWHNDVVISVLFGVALATDSLVRIAATYLVRFPRWQIAVAGSTVELVLALLCLTPWPVPYEGSVPFCVGVAVALTGWTMLRLALAIRRLPEDAPISALPLFTHRGWWQDALQLEAPHAAADHHGQTMVVHIWTPVGAATDPRRRPLLDRYVAAVDRAGVVSTGHAALELPPDLYVSHYPQVEQERTGAEFRQLLRADRANDVPGRFFPSYAEEAAWWCDSTVRVLFRRFDPERLRAFCAAYMQNDTYNLTNRNCSVVVALALDAALEGVLGPPAVWGKFFRLLTHPDLWLASVLRERARTMTWTPGLVLDYARALRHVTEPHGAPWHLLLAHAVKRWRAARAARRVGIAAARESGV